jgi:Protein of unknown function (DUF3489)
MTFTIDADDIIATLASQETDLRKVGTHTVTNPHQLNAPAKSPGPRLVKSRNKRPPVERSASRQATRIRKGTQKQPTGRSSRKVAPKKAKKKPGRRGNTKTAKVIALLQRPEGATLKAIMRVTKWQTHSVRGFISGQLKKKLGLKIRSSQREGERVYSIKS